MPTEIPNNLFRASQPLTGKIVENHLLTPPEPFERQVCHLVIRYTESFPYLPGQSVGVIPGTDPKTSKPYKLRLFSIASTRKGDSGDGQSVSLCVVRHFWDHPQTGEKHIRGTASNYICDLQKGDTIQMTGPVGRHFILPDDFKKRDILFLATGTGIAPYRGMLKEMFDAGFEGQVWLFFGTQKRDRLLYHDEFKTYEKHKNFHYRPSLSREEINPIPDRIATHENRMYVQVKMAQEADTLKEILARPSTLIYLCGLKGMEKGILPLIDQWGNELNQKTPWSTTLKSEKRLLQEVY
jgi:ferredoxin--NADP+ reductase